MSTKHEEDYEKTTTWYLFPLICGSILAAVAAYALMYKVGNLTADERTSSILVDLLASCLLLGIGFYGFLRQGNSRIASASVIVIFIAVIVLTSKVIDVSLS